MKYKNLIILLISVLISGLASAQTGRYEKDLSGKGWKLWLDRAAIWANDSAYLPPINIASLPVNPPTIGWEKLHNNDSLKTVNVPGTVEEHYWGAIGGIIPNVGGDYKGVSWWSKKFNLDESLRGKRIILSFQSVNLRAEVFVNGKLVGYDVVGNTQFEVNATDAVVFGRENQLDVRITDPVGNFSWDDNTLMRWGNNLVPAVHGFGGITGNVIVRATDKVSVSDIYVQNQPDPKNVNIIVTLDNYTGAPQNGTLDLTIHEKGNPKAVVWSKSVPASVTLTSNVITVPATVANAKLWELSVAKTVHKANLYEAAVKFTSTNKKIVDNSKQRFGFRWFDVGEKDGDKRFYLNGKRVFLLAAMTRGIWPKNGMFPTAEWAKRDMQTMFNMGFNMMLMHRAIGQPGVLNYADSSGLFTYEEPGGYRVTANKADKITGPDAQALQWRSEKVKRMVLRDRSFPSMVIYNLKNEELVPPTDADKKDMLMMHSYDPSRIITWNSGNDVNKSGAQYYADRPEDPNELNMMPFKPALNNGGWWDQHHWYAYGGYTDEMYRNPKFYLRGVINAATAPLATDSIYPLNKKKVIFFGEEGAFGTMVRLQKIKEEIERDPSGATGYREMEHIDWFNHYNKFLDETGFRKAYPDVDSLTRSLGRNLHYFHGRNIENVRMGNIADAYNINGWAAEGITRTDVVDAYRYPTADASIIKHYTQPLYVAVKLRNKVISVNSAPIADMYLINEKDLKGKHTLNVNLYDDKGKVLFKKSFEVDVKGGEDFGQLLVENIQLPAITQQGYYNLKATLNAGTVKKADGFDEIYAVAVNDRNAVKGNIAVLETDDAIKNYLKEAQGITTSAFSAASPQESTIVIGTYGFETITAPVMDDIFKRVQNGAKLIIFSNADRFAQQIDAVIKDRPPVYGGGAIINNSQGRFFTGFSPFLTGLPQGQGMSWEYQVFYKGVQMGQRARISGIRLSTAGNDLIVALSDQGSKEILASLARVPVGKGSVTLSTLNLLPNLASKESHAVVAKKLFLNLLAH